jgi:hypothetical protein
MQYKARVKAEFEQEVPPVYNGGSSPGWKW